MLLRRGLTSRTILHGGTTGSEIKWQLGWPSARGARAKCDPWRCTPTATHVSDRRPVEGSDLHSFRRGQSGMVGYAAAPSGLEHLTTGIFMKPRPRLDIAGADRLIVALDVSTHDDAFRLVDNLTNVSFFKVGLQLLMSGDILGFLKKLRERRNGGVFVDLKLSGDIGNTIIALVNACMALNVKFITLVPSTPESITISTLEAAREARRDNPEPHFLMVPLLSSLNEDDIGDVMTSGDLSSFIIRQSENLLSHGSDGLIVSGREIKACRDKFPEIDIVSPGIRPEKASADDHKRYTTPREAIHFGADYLVVGRPITQAPRPKVAAQQIIDEIDRALDEWLVVPASTSAATPIAHRPKVVDPTIPERVAI